MASPSTLKDVISSQHSTRTAVVIPDGPALNYSQLQQQIQHIAACLHSFLPSFPPTTAIALSLVNNLEFTASFLAITWLRGVAAPLNAGYTVDENKFYLDDMKCAAVLVMKGQGQHARKAAADYKIPVLEIGYDKHKQTLTLTAPDGKPIQPRTVSFAPQPTDVCLILHTSGTTSRPKAVPLTHRNICTSIANISRTYDLTANDRTLIVMPLFHVHGLIGVLLSTLATGGMCIIPPRFSATAFWGLFDRYQCTWYSSVPTIHQILVSQELKNNPNPPSPVKQRPYHRFIRSCSSALAPATMQQLEALYGVPVVEAYAMTEAAHQMTSNNLPHKGKRKPASVGPGQGVKVAVLNDSHQPLPTGEIGEVSIQGANVTPGYLNNEAANSASFTPNGWFRTGDQGYLDEDGYVFLTGRLKELINRGGEKISPLEIDHVLLQSPLVAEAIAFGVNDAKYGQEVAAAVVLKPNAEVRQPAEVEKRLQEWCKKQMSEFKVPKRIYVADTLPRTATGKIQRRHVASAFEGKKEPATGKGAINSKL